MNLFLFVSKRNCAFWAEHGLNMLHHEKIVNGIKGFNKDLLQMLHLTLNCINIMMQFQSSEYNNMNALFVIKSNHLRHFYLLWHQNDY